MCHTKHERFAWLNSFVTVVSYTGDVTHDLYDCEIFRKTSDKHSNFRNI